MKPGDLRQTSNLTKVNVYNTFKYVVNGYIGFLKEREFVVIIAVENASKFPICYCLTKFGLGYVRGDLLR